MRVLTYIYRTYLPAIIQQLAQQLALISVKLAVSTRLLPGVLLTSLAVSSSVHGGLQCVAGTDFNGPHYPDMLSAMLSRCQHHLYPTRLGTIGFIDSNGGNFSCDTYNDGKWSHWNGWTVACIEEEFADAYLDLSNVDIDNEGAGKVCESTSNPINLLNGNKYKIHIDVDTAISGDISRPGFTRYYNSHGLKTGNHVMGLNWRHSYQRRIIPQDGFRTGTNYFRVSGGASSNSLQSVLMGDKQTACETGFANLIEERTNNPATFANLERVMSGTVVWTGSKCVVKDDYGKYIATIPMFIHNGVSSAYTPGYFTIRLTRPDGKEYEYKRDVQVAGGNGFDWVAENAGATGSLREIVAYLPDSNGLLTVRRSVFEYIDAKNVKEIYSETGELLEIHNLNGITQTLSYNSGILERVDDNLGRAIVFAYHPDGKVEYVTDETGRQWHYQYDTAGRLEFVTNPDSTTKQYHYEDAIAGNLTGLTDERGIRYSTFTYYPDGLARESYLGPPAAPIELKIEGVSLAYSPGLNSLTDSRGNNRAYHFGDNVVGSEIFKDLLTQFDGPECAGCAGGSSSFVYDINTSTPANSTLNLLSKTEYDLQVDYADYDEKNNPQTITEAVGTPEEIQKTYTYDPRFQSKITSITEPSVYTGSNKITSYSYDDFGNTTSEIIDGFRPDGTPVSRTTTYTYNGPLNQLSEINGPRTDVADIYTLEYYPDSPANGNNRARLKKITAPEDVVLYDNISYTATGNIDTYTGLNGLQVDMGYYPGNDRLEVLTQTDAGTGEIRKTRWNYLATGEVETITQGYATPAATTITFGYDDARRLTRIYDGFNNYIEYTLDTAGNVVAEKIHNPSGFLQKALNQTFDAYNRLDISAQANETRNRDFAPDGTLDREVDGKNVVTDYSYDALRRLTTIVQDMGGAAPASANALTQLDYDMQNNLVAVTDPNGGRTEYTYDDLGNLLSLSSPDSGTAVYTHDAAGNTITMTDAKGQAFSYRYDALGRRLMADAPGVEDDVVYSYDNCVNGGGKLCSVARAGAVVSYSYNAFGETSTVSQSVDAFPPYEQAVSQLTYSYDETGRLKDMMYPSGNKITYTYDMAGNVDNVILNDVEANLVTNAEYYPFGPPKLVTRGNATSIFGYMDNAYRTWIIGNGGYFYDIIYYDANGNPVTFYSSEGRQSHTYDALDRLDTSTGPYGTRDYDYDLNGNRTGKTVDSVTHTYGYDANSNRMNSSSGGSVVQDANGNSTSFDGLSISYTADNRMADILGKASYTYNGLSERSMKAVAAPATAGAYGYSIKTVYVYGTDGKLLAELGPTGQVKQEYVYLNDQLLATFVYTPAGGEQILNADMDSDGAISVDDYLIWFFNHYMTGDISREVTGDGVLNSADTSLLVNCAISGGSGAGCVTSSYNREIYYAHNDHLGTPHMLTDESGAAVWSALYDPFGKAMLNEDVDGDGSSITLNVRFPGQYYDAESGLHYNYYRTYDPESGRYVTSDPIGLAGGLNTFGYAFQNSLKYFDTLGLDANTVHVGINIPFVGGIDVGFVLFDGTNGGGLFGSGGGPLDFGLFGTIKKPIGGYANGKVTVGLSQTLGCRNNFDGTGDEVELGLVIFGLTAGGLGDNDISNNSLGIELGVTAGYEAFQTQTGSLTIRDIIRFVSGND